MVESDHAPLRTRAPEAAHLAALVETPLWRARLCPNGRFDADIFPAFRSGRTDFYYRGGKLCAFDGSAFRTHIKYATHLTHQSPYISEAELAGASVVPDFVTAYEGMKDRCAQYAGAEAAGVFEVARSWSFVQAKGPVVVLDLEIALPSLDEGTLDQIDLLLFHTEEKRLRFVEAKRLSDSRLWSRNGTPEAFSQLERYEGQLQEREQELLATFQGVVAAWNELGILAKPLPSPERLDPGVTLFVFDFTGADKKHRLDADLVPLLREEDLRRRDAGRDPLRYYAKGVPKGLNVMQLWNAKPAR